METVKRGSSPCQFRAFFSFDEPTLATPEQQSWVASITAARQLREARGRPHLHLPFTSLSHIHIPRQSHFP